MNDSAPPSPDRTGKPLETEQQTQDAPASDMPKRIGRYRVDKLLGQGGFGKVYLGWDETLNRPVAIKVPKRELVSRQEDAEIYLAEVRTVAALDHLPHIVPIYDVGSTPEYPFFAVSKFIEGRTLASALKERRPSVDEAAELVATVAIALHHAHQLGFVHRDVKPGNILIDTAGKPYVADFGLALREEDFDSALRRAGTPGYMSPEQARGEGHRVDGRSDIFSLGVVLYELITGRRPFRGKTNSELLERITTQEARPPRQLDDGIPKELERICLKALSKRASDRYTTARDLAEELLVFARSHGVVPRARQNDGNNAASDGSEGETKVRPAPAVADTPAASDHPAKSGTPSATPSEGQPIRIVPKGLRSFDVHDADFFLELLPGPRDREGLPDSIRFWKTRIENLEADETFSVGLIYGPSGCGKSSLVKAGLLPRLSNNIIVVYVEATGDDTEARLLHSLRKRCPALPLKGDLKDAMKSLRRGHGTAPGRKVLIVLDQFEQWLHAKREERDAELVQALRQCDGARVQCLVMVRDDFWLAVSRFMREVEVQLIEGQNSALVDLFDVDHAKRVLAAFGRAFGKLPEKPSETDKEQKEFLKQAIAGLASEGKVVCVRLALFAEMMKGRQWTPSSLKQVGGTAGVGVTFLEETFGAATAPPSHRLHRNAIRAVLQALLPESGSNLKGHLRSEADLREASGYGNRVGEFNDLVDILDAETRLITPTDPEGAEALSATVSGGKYYQLTHDYLVPSVSEWLARKKKETRRGRAELVLEDRAAVWNSRPENRQLPSLLQWLTIRCWTQRRNWTDAQRRMMQRAGRHHGVRSLVVAAGVVLFALIAWETFGRLRAQALRDRLLEAATADVPAIVEGTGPYRRWLDPLLHEVLTQEGDRDSKKRLHASLALMPVDRHQGAYVYSRVLRCEPQDFAILRDSLAARRQEYIGDLWGVLQNEKTNDDMRFRAACALADYDSENASWNQVKRHVAETLVKQNPAIIRYWIDALWPLKNVLMDPLADILEDEGASEGERTTATSLFEDYAAGRPEALASLAKRLSAGMPATLPGEERTLAAKRLANVGVALMQIGDLEGVQPLLKHTPDPTARTYFIDRVAASRVPAERLVALADKLPEDAAVRQAIILGLGQYDSKRIPKGDLNQALRMIARVYREDADPGVHGAADWLLRRWGSEKALREVDGEAKDRDKDASRQGRAPAGNRGWYVNSQGQTMAIVTPRGEFWMGAGRERHRQTVRRTYAIACKEVTVEQFRMFQKDHLNENEPTERAKRRVTSEACPAVGLSWYEAAAYCNWLNEQENIDPKQWCYQKNDQGRYVAGMRIAADALLRTGYRLPTDVEWEYACRARTETSFCFGEAADLVGQYAWYSANSHDTTHPVGVLKPNEFGLFDIHGNAWEWCQGADAYDGRQAGIAGVWKELPDILVVRDTSLRVLRGGDASSSLGNLRSADHSAMPPAKPRLPYAGLRVTRTVR